MVPGSPPELNGMHKSNEVSIKLTPEHFFFFQGNVFLLTFLIKLGHSRTQSECSKDRGVSAPGGFPAPGTAWPALPQRQGRASLLGRAGLGSQAQLLTQHPPLPPHATVGPYAALASRCCCRRLLVHPPRRNKGMAPGCTSRTHAGKRAPC